MTLCLAKTQPDWPGLGFNPVTMEATESPTVPLQAKPICVGLTCWRWQSKKPQAILRLGQRLGVTIKLTERIHGLRRDIQAEVSGRNIDRFIGEFVRHC